jgi:exodeoxyribonuclease V alpha subunit
VERITFHNPENGYTVARLAPERPPAELAAARHSGPDHLVTVVGTLADLTPGEAIVARGWWKNDPKYGWQFVAVEYRTTLPATLQGMKKYLGSGLVKGVGPVMGGRIVDTFGEATLEVIDTTPERLTEVPGIGPIRARRIAAAWEEQRHIREVMVALQGYGVSTSLAVRIFKRFGNESARVIQQEPYRLAREVWGIGFKTADKIAQAVGITPDAPERLQAGVLHALGEAADEGHTLLPDEALARRAAALLGVDAARLGEVIATLRERGEVLAATPRPPAAGATNPAGVPLAGPALARTHRPLSGRLGPVPPGRSSPPGLTGAGREGGAPTGAATGPRPAMVAEAPAPYEGLEDGPRQGPPPRPVQLLALAPFARAETSVAGRLRALQAAAQRPDGTPAGRHFRQVDWPAAFRWLAQRHRLVLAPEQEAAVRMALTEPVSLLTGGPGTGKTHTLRAILTLARVKRLRCVLAAPTGRAAKRMEEATGLAAGTLHRVLELRPGGQAGRHAGRPLEADLVVVDEASMLDALLANQLVKALAPGTHLLLVGDPDQLPSVGAGDVLADLLGCGQFPVTRLCHIFRQGAGSGIAQNARRINAGELPLFGRALGKVQDCFFLPAETPQQAAQVVVDLVAQRLPARYGFARGEVQVLAPMHRGEAGVGMLNLLLQERLNPARPGLPELRAGGRVYRPGDRVLQLQNDYELSVFNGDLGTVQAVDPVEQQLTLVLDDGREVRYPAAGLLALTHAYAISVHKAQGAEFPAVVIPLLTSHAPMLSRTLLYTALTRARQLVVIVGHYKALRLAVRDWRREPRHTALGALLAGTLSFTWPHRPPGAGRAATPAVAFHDADAVEPWDAPDPWQGWEGLLSGGAPSDPPR